MFGCTTEASVEIYYGAVTQAVFDAVFEAKTRCELKVESFLYTSPLYDPLFHTYGTQWSMVR